MISDSEIFDDTYRLIRFIGEGGMGAVYEATHARLAGRYAIKVLLPAVSANPEALERFHREARITSLLQHPNVVEVIDYNTAADGTEYLVMEYLAGESLAQRLFREGPLPVDTVIGVVEQIAAGLAAAHARGIVHRDLKPDNVFLVPVEGREAESVKILDFGISKVKGPNWGLQAPEGTLYGTPQYMAPEQIDGRETQVDAATDQFSLAVLTYEMLTGHSPFQGDSLAAVFSQVLKGVPAPTGISDEVDLVLRRGLAKENRKRFACVTDFADAIRSAARGTRLRQRPAILPFTNDEISIFKSKARPRRGNWGLTLIATVVASISISLVAGGFVAGGAANRRAPATHGQAESGAGLPPLHEVVGRAIDRLPVRLGTRLAEVSAHTTKVPSSPVYSERFKPTEPAPSDFIDPALENAGSLLVPAAARRATHRSSVARLTGSEHSSPTTATGSSSHRYVASWSVDADATLPLDETR